MKWPFEDRRAVVTGAGGGIGAEVSRMFGASGARVALLDIDGAAVRNLTRQIASEKGVALPITCDVANADNVEDAFSQIEDEWGGVDILVNNAGVTRDNLIFKMSIEDWDMVIDTHLKGSFLCSRAAQRYMVQQRYGKIVNVSSRAAMGNRGQINYSSAKAGLQGMTRALAIELGPFGINVNAVAPGHIDTEMTRQTADRMGISNDDLIASTIEKNAIKRVGAPLDISHAIGFLASDLSSYITGHILYVAGRPIV